MLHALGFTGRARGVENEQGMFGAYRHGRTYRGLTPEGFIKGLVAARHHGAGRCGALIDQHALEGVAAAHGDALIDDGLERELLATAHLEIGGDHSHRARIDDAFVEGLGREATEHHAVRRTDPRAGLHRDHAFDGHGHVDDDPVTLFDALRREGIGELAHSRQQLLVGHPGDGAVIGFKHDRRLVLDRRTHMLVQAVGRGIEFAVVEPFVKRRVRLVERACKGPGPDHVLARQARPISFEISGRLLAQGVIAGHARDVRRGDDGGGGRKYAVFDQDRLDGTHACLRCFTNLGVTLSLGTYELLTGSLVAIEGKDCPSSPRAGPLPTIMTRPKRPSPPFFPPCKPPVLCAPCPA